MIEIQKKQKEIIIKEEKKKHEEEILRREEQIKQVLKNVIQNGKIYVKEKIWKLEK